MYIPLSWKLYEVKHLKEKPSYLDFKFNEVKILDSYSW